MRPCRLGVRQPPTSEYEDGSMKVQRTRKHAEASAVHAAAKRPGDVVLLESRSIQNNTVIRFQVHGLPIAQGSQRSWMVNGKPVITAPTGSRCRYNAC